MDEDTLSAFGTCCGILERRGACTTHELAETIGGVALMTAESGGEYEGRARYIGRSANMVCATAIGAGGVQHH